jgi:hypothetical protein
MQHGLSINGFEENVLGSDEYFADSNPSGTATNTTFPAALYKAMRNRTPDQRAESFWISLLNANKTTRADVAKAIVASSEWQSALVVGDYKDFFSGLPCQARSPTGRRCSPRI